MLAVTQIQPRGSITAYHDQEDMMTTSQMNRNIHPHQEKTTAHTHERARQSFVDILEIITTFIHYTIILYTQLATELQHLHLCMYNFCSFTRRLNEVAMNPMPMDERRIKLFQSRIKTKPGLGLDKSSQNVQLDNNVRVFVIKMKMHRGLGDIG